MGVDEISSVDVARDFHTSGFVAEDVVIGDFEMRLCRWQLAGKLHRPELQITACKT